MTDLITIDPYKKILYLLGDTESGSTLVGMSLITGNQTCHGTVPLKEMGYVGLAQSIDYDTAEGSIILSGLSMDVTGGHLLLRNKGCVGDCIAKTELIGTFGDAAYVPMLHASAFDPAGQRLFLTVGLTKTTSGLGVIDLKGKPGNMLRVIPEDDEHVLLGMQYDHQTESLIGIVPNDQTGMAIRSLHLDPETSKATWNTTTLPKQDFEWLYGNSGSVSAFDSDNGVLYVLAGARPSPSRGEPNTVRA